MWTLPSSSSSLVGVYCVATADEEWCNFVSVALFFDENIREIAMSFSIVFRSKTVVV
jgi:hypothetical protein